MTEEEIRDLIKRYNEQLNDWNLKREEFTCNKCVRSADGGCRYAWDLYNLRGDCLESK